MMNVLNRPVRESLVPVNPAVNSLSLYDQYGAVAYGVILQLVPQPLQAQEILVDLFASPDLPGAMASSSNKICQIIRLARDRALEFRQKQQVPLSPVVPSGNQSELIFNLLFYQNRSPDSIADQLQIKRSAVFGAVREFFASVLPS